MKEEIKQKLNNTKEYIIEHESDIIVFCANAALAFVIGRVCGTIIGKYINTTNAEAFSNGYQRGMTYFHDRMLTDNVNNPEVVKALVVFQDKYTK